MDQAVALVQAYLHVNGYFTVCEYPILEAVRHDSARSVTDLDVLAFRFPHAGHGVIHRHDQRTTGVVLDAALGSSADQPDMIIGEVKEGAARFNPASRNEAVLEMALARFGCCPPAAGRQVARELLSRGRAETAAGHVVRMVAFGSAREANDTQHWLTVPMTQVVRFLSGYLHQHWDVLRHAQLRDPGLSMLALLEKWRITGREMP